MKTRKSELSEFEADIQGENTEDKVLPVQDEPKEGKPVLPVIPLKVFCSLSGKKPDQIAGFMVYAKMKELKPMTIPAWQEELTAFQNKPTR